MTTSSSSHSHPTTAIDAAIKALQAETATLAASNALLAASIEALTTRVEALETTEPPPPSGNPTVVGSVAEMMNALRDVAARDIVLRNGTYPMTWLDVNGAYPGHIRTPETAVLLRAETTGGVVLDAQGSKGVHQLFRDGAAYQTWQGFRYANSHPYDNGVVQFGEGQGIPVHHLTLRDIAFDASIVMDAGPSGAYRNGQGIYCSWSKRELGGNHDILVDGFTSNARLWSAVHVYHDTEGHVGHHVTFKRVAIGPEHTMGLALAANSIHDFLFEDVTITGANEYGVYHYYGTAATTITLRRVKTTGSGVAGLYSRSNQAGLTIEACSFA